MMGEQTQRLSEKRHDQSWQLVEPEAEWRRRIACASTSHGCTWLDAGVEIVVVVVVGVADVVMLLLSREMDRADRKESRSHPGGDEKGGGSALQPSSFWPLGLCPCSADETEGPPGVSRPWHRRTRVPDWPVAFIWLLLLSKPSLGRARGTLAWARTLRPRRH